MSDIKIITFSGPSGSGKTTIVGRLLRLNPKWKLIVSHTTRAPRSSDLPGEYRCKVSKREFSRREKRREFIWTVSVHDNKYGTLFESIDQALRKDHASVMLLTPDSIPLLLKYIPGKALSFFILPPPEEALRERLKLRGETFEAIERRIADCKKWAEEAKSSGIPYVFIDNSGAVDEAVQQVLDATNQLRLV